MNKVDVLIIGSGIAGAVAAITAADRGRNVMIITKTEQLLSGSTPHAQGGIIYKGEDDSPEELTQDIMDAGDGSHLARSCLPVGFNGPKISQRNSH